MTLAQLAWECNDDDCNAGYSEDKYANGGRSKVMDTMKHHVYRTGHEVTLKDKRSD